MKRSFWITLTVSITVGVVAVVAQAARNKGLAQRLVVQQVDLAPAGNAGPAAVVTVADEGQAQDRLERALAKLGELEPADPEAKVDDRPPRIFADFLRSVDGLGFDELVAAAGETADPTMKKWMLLLAAEQEPVRLFRSGKWKGVFPLGQLAEAIAVNDPAAVMEILPPLELREPERKVGYLYREPELDAHIRAADRLLSSDLDLGLQAFLNIRDVLDAAEVSSISMGEFGPTLLRPFSEDSVPGIIEAMGDPRYGAIRDDLRERLVLDGQFKGGVARVIELSDAMELTPEEQRLSAIEMLGEGIMDSEPEAMLAWMVDVSPDRIPRAFVKWAEMDQKAATDWIVQQEPSPTRDQAIATFAMEASSLDLEAAAEWSLKIQDEAFRESTLRRVLSR